MPRPPAMTIARPCPACRGQILAKRCPTAHRTMLICDCGWRGPLPETLRLRLRPPAAWRQLELFEENNDAE